MVRFVLSSKSAAFAKKPTKSALVNEKGISLSTVFLCSGNGQITAVIPKMSNMLDILLPITLPMANSELPSKLAIILTISSGIEVPKDTMVM